MPPAAGAPNWRVKITDVKSQRGVIQQRGFEQMFARYRPVGLAVLPVKLRLSCRLNHAVLRCELFQAENGYDDPA